MPKPGGVAARRTLEGSTAVCLGGGFAAAIGLLLFGVDPLTAAAVGAGCGLFGALVEAFSHHGLDNLTIQVAGSAVAFVLLG